MPDVAAPSSKTFLAFTSLMRSRNWESRRTWSCLAPKGTFHYVSMSNSDIIRFQDCSCLAFSLKP